MEGILYIVATPIGNLGDLSYRATSILNYVDLIAAEDTRTSKKLLDKYNIKTPMISYHNFNEQQKYTKIIDRLALGENIALISDAGTPCISDPGYLLINSAKQLNIKVITIPGPSAVIAALSVSGIPTDCYFFEGFLPHKKGRQARLKVLQTLVATIVIYESPLRVLRTLRDIKKYFGERVVSICKELTKIHEETYLGLISDSINHFEINKPKGEFVIMVAKENYKLK